MREITIFRKLYGIDSEFNQFGDYHELIVEVRRENGARLPTLIYLHGSRRSCPLTEEEFKRACVHLFYQK